LAPPTPARPGGRRGVTPRDPSSAAPPPPRRSDAMAYATAQGARIYYEEAGRGTPVLFIHEFAGDHRSWDDQMRHFGRGWRALTWGARGYPPSGWPDGEGRSGLGFVDRYSVAVLDAA